MSNAQPTPSNTLTRACGRDLDARHQQCDRAAAALVEKAERGTGQWMIEARDVTIAGHIIDKVWFTRRRDKDFTWMSQFMDQPIVGAIGGEALHHFRISVDYPNAVAVFELAK